MKLPETDKTRYDVHSPTLVDDIKKAIPPFDKYEGDLPIKKLSQYIILMYDPESPMRREVGHYMQRKSACAEVVGFKKEGSKWMLPIDELLIGKDEDANKLFVAYIAHLAIPEYLELITLLEIQRVKSMEAFSGNVTDNTHKTIAAVTKSISEITKKLFGSGEEDEIKAARRALYEQADIDKPPMPEDMVDKLNEGPLPEDMNPYGDYRVEEGKFLGDEEPL
ncbi:hypothetical protein LCGC14_1354180 [marine sediment metagenome]|uniref:Uncharacterized protein n=1 Tax=marine sediment metagenome TaxID=412755 RepID=A0A0F9NCA0_9ZZZZ